MTEAHGGKLISKKIDFSENSFDKNSFFQYNIDIETAKDIINIANGAYSPLEGFMNEDDLDSVVLRKKLSNGLVWTLPIYFKIPSQDSKFFEIGNNVLLKNSDLGLEAILSIESKYQYDQEKFVINVFGTKAENHPGVKEAFSPREYIIGGEINLLSQNTRIFPQFNLSPIETRKTFDMKGWKSIVAFQTRNPAHLAHEHLQKVALEFVDGLFIQPIMGKKKSGDFKDEVILEVYKNLINEFYPKDSTMLGIFPSRMNYAGPREAVHHAIVRKNYGCTHIIIGRDHAGVGNFYDTFAAHRIFDEIGDIGIQPLRFSQAFYSKKSRMITTQKTSPFDDPNDRIAPSGTEVRRLFKEKNIPEIEKFMRREVIDTILRFDQPFVD